jgi:hypothetical protein
VGWRRRGGDRDLPPIEVLGSAPPDEALTRVSSANRDRNPRQLAVLAVVALVALAALTVLADGGEPDDRASPAESSTSTTRRRTSTSERRTTTSARPTTTTTLPPVPAAASYRLYVEAYGVGRVIDLATGRVSTAREGSYVMLDGDSYAQFSDDGWHVVVPGGESYPLDLSTTSPAGRRSFGAEGGLLPGGSPGEVYVIHWDGSPLTFDRVVAGEVVERGELPPGFSSVRGTTIGLLASSGMGGVVIRDGRIVRRLEGEPVAATARFVAVRSCEDDLTCGVEVVSLDDGTSWPVSSATGLYGAISRDGRHLVLQDNDGPGRLFDVASGEARDVDLSFRYQMVFSPDGRWLAAADDVSVVLIDLESTARYEYALGAVSGSLAFLPAARS